MADSAQSGTARPPALLVTSGYKWASARESVGENSMGEARREKSTRQFSNPTGLTGREKTGRWSQVIH